MIIITSKYAIIPWFVKWPLFLLQMMIGFHSLYMNPGIPDRNPPKANRTHIERYYQYCNICKIYYKINSNTFHCKICDICVEDFDHHCGFFNKCIGKWNYFTFYANFIFFIIVCLLIFADTFPIIGHMMGGYDDF